jgi:ATP-dependent Clp protease ATP-binding subunit ClpA
MNEKGTRVTYSEDVLEYIAEKSFSEKFGARNMRRYICRHVEDMIAERMISDYSHTIAGISLKYSKKENKLWIECI